MQRVPRTRTSNRRPPLSGKQPTTPTTRKERRAAERRDRFDAARDERRTRAGSSGGGGSSFINTRTMTIAGIAIGVLIVAVVAIGQLGDRATGRLTDPGFTYPASILDGSNLGQAGAPVVLEVWEDYQCPVCASHSLEVEPLIVSKYVVPGQLQIVHNDISLLGRGGPSDPNDESTITAKGAYCANEQGLYWPYAHWLYINQQGENAGGFRRERVVQIAVSAGVDEAAFGACLDSSEATAHVTASTQAAADLAINSTPTLRINGGELLRGLLDPTQLSQLIDEALAGTSPVPSTTP
jgi:protein-disulfide isomerase